MTAGGAPEWEWPDSLDALLAAPRNHRLYFEHEDVRLLDTRIGPGETARVHTHRRTSPMAPHKEENVREVDVRVLNFELKR